MLRPPTIDARDLVTLAARQIYLITRGTPDVGDFVVFPDETVRRISHVWDFPDDRKLSGYQTSDGGSFYLGPDYVSYSGSLYPCQPWGSLEPTYKTRPGRAWFFHHNYAKAHNGVEVMPEFREWRSLEPPRR